MSIIELYRNPIFGVLVLLAIVLAIVVMDSVKLSYSRKKKRESLENLSKSFDSFDLQQNIADFMQHVKNPLPTIRGLAQIYSQVGNHQQATAMYQILNEHTKGTQDKIEILELLARSYYSAGFLQRAKAVLLEVLRLHPSNASALNSLVQTSESLGEYKEALEALDCLEEVQEGLATKVRIPRYRCYLSAMQVISNTKLPLIAQQEQLLELYRLDESLNLLILRHFKLYNRGLFWQKILELDSVYECMELLWHFDIAEVPLHSIPLDHEVSDIYRAKGYLSDYRPIAYLPLEALQLLRQNKSTEGDLEFSYQCDSCKAASPFYSYRCQACGDIGELKLKCRFVE